MSYVEKTPTGRYRGVYRDRAGRKHSRAFDIRRDAREWAGDREAEVRHGTHVDPRAGRLLLRDWEPAWWEARVVAATTRATNRGRVDRYILPAFGERALDEITAMFVQGWVGRLTSEHGLSADTVRNCHGLLSSMLDAAVREKLIRENVARARSRRHPDGIVLPAKGLGRETYYTRDQVGAIEAEMPVLYRPIVTTLVWTGMRWGELAGLHRDQLDMLRRQVEVSRSCEQIGGHFGLKPPKDYERRTLPLPTPLVTALAAHLEDAAHLPCGMTHPARERCTGLVFARPSGRPFSRHWFSRDVFAAAIERANRGRKPVDRLPAGTPHDLRHTYASWLVQDGVPISVVSKLLGHATTATTERYAHLAPDAFSAALRVLDRQDQGAGTGRTRRQRPSGGNRR